MDLSFQQNQTFTLSLNVQRWQPIYPLPNCIFHMQIRPELGSVQIVYSWSSNLADGWGNGTINYTSSTGLLFFSAPYSDMLSIMPGTYVWDLELLVPGITSGVFQYKSLTGGNFTVTQGVTK